METALRADLEPDLAQHSHDDSEAAPDLPTGRNCSDYIDGIVDGRGLRQRVITQPRPKADAG